MSGKKSITVFPYYGPFENQPKARAKYLEMRLQDDIRRAARGRDPQVVWEGDLYGALHLVAKSVRERKKAITEEEGG